MDDIALLEESILKLDGRIDEVERKIEEQAKRVEERENEIAAGQGDDKKRLDDAVQKERQLREKEGQLREEKCQLREEKARKEEYYINQSRGEDHKPFCHTSRRWAQSTHPSLHGVSSACCIQASTLILFLCTQSAFTHSCSPQQFCYQLH